jgi:hypothetical protein
VRTLGRGAAVQPLDALRLLFHNDAHGVPSEAIRRMKDLKLQAGIIQGAQPD